MRTQPPTSAIAVGQRKEKWVASRLDCTLTGKVGPTGSNSSSKQQQIGVPVAVVSESNNSSDEKQKQQ